MVNHLAHYFVKSAKRLICYCVHRTTLWVRAAYTSNFYILLSIYFQQTATGCCTACVLWMPITPQKWFVGDRTFCLRSPCIFVWLFPLLRSKVYKRNMFAYYKHQFLSICNTKQQRQFKGHYDILIPSQLSFVRHFR